MALPPRPIALASAALVLGGAPVGVLTGCAGTAGPQARHASSAANGVDWPGGSDPYQQLLTLQNAEIPSAARLPAPVLRGLDTAALAPITDDDPNVEQARTPLGEVLERRRVPRLPAGDAPQPPGEAAMVRAKRLYASGSAKLLDNDAAGAARDLAAAAQLDPTAAAPWLKLADAQARMGQAGASILSRRKAADLGSEDAVSLAILGIQTARTGQHELAAHYLARCLAADPSQADPLLRQVVMVRLADPLAQLGYLQASAEALEAGLELPRRLNSPTRFGEEAADIARRVSDLWVQIGDTMCRLGEDRRAAEAYETAAGVPSIDPGAIMTRRAYVLLRSGRAASVALLVLDDIAAREGRADSRDLALLSVLRGDQTVGPLVRRALEDLAATLDGPMSPTTASRLTLARAAASPDRFAMELLTERAAESPGDGRVLDALFARCADAEAIEAAALDLVERSPGSAGAIAKAMLPWHPSPGPLCDSLLDSRAGRLLRAHLLLVLDRPAEALAAAEGSGDGATVALAAAMAGDWTKLDRVVTSLSHSTVEVARALKAAQRYEEALEALGPALEGPNAPIDTLLLGAELSVNTGDAERALALLDRAVGADPYDARVYEGLINVHQSRGDQQAAGEAIRTLREQAPSSHLLRWVRAQEEARRGLLDQAERAARELVEDSTDSGGALGLLLSVWAQRNAVGDTGSLEDAAGWLAQQTGSPPVSGELLAAQGTVLQLLGRSEESERVLRSAYEARPTPVVSKALENLLRATDRAEEGDALAEARFAASGNGIDAALDRAEFRARDGRWSEAVDAAISAMPKAALLTPQQRGRVVQLAGQMSGRLQQPDVDAVFQGDLLRLLTSAENAGVVLPWQLGYTYWALLSDDAAAPTSRVVTAAVSFLESIDSLETASRVIGNTASQLGVPTDTLDQARGQIAYQLAGSLYAMGREPASLEVYRVALRYSPDHAWAANDLGYFLVERGEELDRAEELLSRAYELRPDQSNIADSLGWLRYKLGQFENETLADGSVREGAVSLLIAATGLPGGDSNATIHDHLGDALWRSGDRERARASWIRAQQILFGELTALRDGGSSPQRDALTEEASGVGRKLDALDSGGEPPVPPLLGE